MICQVTGLVISWKLEGRPKLRVISLICTIDLSSLLCHVEKFELYILSEFAFCSTPVSFLSNFAGATQSMDRYYQSNLHIFAPEISKVMSCVGQIQIEKYFQPFLSFDFVETKWRRWLGNYEERLLSC